MKGLLVGMLCCGENEQQRSMASLKSQKFRDWDLFTLENVPNKEAHDRLYARFMSEAGNYKWFLKLDADMVFSGADGLDTLLSFLDRPNRDRLLVDLHDWISDSTIPAAHAFSNRVHWGPNPDRLAVDHAPEFKGESFRLWSAPAPFIVHSPDPLPFQAFRFGVHRALKAIQPDRRKKDIGRALFHWSLLKNVWRSHCRLGDERRLLAVLGAEAVLGDEYDVEELLENYAGDYTREVFESISRAGLRESLAPRLDYWNNESMNDNRWLSRLAGGQ